MNSSRRRSGIWDVFDEQLVEAQQWISILRYIATVFHEPAKHTDMADLPRNWLFIGIAPEKKP